VDQIDMKTLLLCAETLVRLRAHLAAYKEFGGNLSETEAKRYSSYDAQVRRSQRPIDQMKSLTTDDLRESYSLNETLSLVLESVTISPL
jgi:hypothetical protein